MAIRRLSLVLLLCCLAALDGYVGGGRSSSSAAVLAAARAVEGSWYSLGDCQVLLPENERVPRSIVHFIGGFVAGSAPSLAYNSMLQELANRGHMVVASPLPPMNSFNHMECAEIIQRSFIQCYNQHLLPILGSSASAVPVIGLSHSLGGKIRILAECNPKRVNQIETCANVFLAFNNFDARQSLDLTTAKMSQLSPELKRLADTIQSPEVQRIVEAARKSPLNGIREALAQGASSSKDPIDVMSSLFSDALNERISSIFSDVDSRVTNLFNDLQRLEFIPSSQETWRMLESEYDNPSNVIFKFKDDDIDQSDDLAFYLRKRGFFPLLLTCNGNHLTPNLAGDLSSSEFMNTLVAQIAGIADYNWGQGRVRSASRTSTRYLPEGRGDRWNSDEY